MSHPSVKTRRGLPYKNGAPQHFEPTRVTQYLDDGSVFLLAQEEKRVWAVYNDSRESAVTVVATFPRAVRPLGSTREVAGGRGAADSVTYAVDVAPLATALFVQYAAAADVLAVPLQLLVGAAGVPLSAATFVGGRKAAAGAGYRAAAAEAVAGPDAALMPRIDRVFPCFRRHRNGMLFRLVDEARGVTAFYNDTPDYRMHVLVELPRAGGEAPAEPLGRTMVLDAAQVSEFRIGCVAGAGVTRYEASGGSSKATRCGIGGGGGDDNTAAPCVAYGLVVEPLCTELCLRGDLSSCQMSFSAEPVAAQQPDYDVAAFRPRRGGPDPRVIEFDQLFRCLKDGEGDRPGEATLLRLVDREAGRWAFYNDATTSVYRVTAVFPPAAASAVKPGPQATLQLASPQGGEDDLPPGTEPGSAVVRAEVPPGRTVLFLSGDAPEDFVLYFEEWSAAASPPPGGGGGSGSGGAPRGRGRGRGGRGRGGRSGGRGGGRGSAGHTREPLCAEAGAEQPVDLAALRLESGGPDTSVVPFSEAYACFPGRGNGLLFRLVSADGTAWGFYNDSRAVAVHVAAKFAHGHDMFANDLGSGVEAAGGTQLVRVTGGGSAPGAALRPDLTLALAVVPPGATVAFLRCPRPQALGHYLLSFRAEAVPDAGAAASLRHPDALRAALEPFRSGAREPEPLLFRCFSRDNGVLFRVVQPLPTGLEGRDEVAAAEAALLVERPPARFLYFNDSDEYTFVVSVRVDPRSTGLRPLGHAVVRRERRRAPRAPPVVPPPASTASAPAVSPALRERGASITNEDLGLSGSEAAAGAAAGRAAADADVDFGASTRARHAAAAAGDSPEELVYTTVVAPGALEPLLEGVIVGSYSFVVRTDAAAENRLISFENGEPRVFESEEQYRAARAVDSAGGGGAGEVEDLLQQPHLRLYRIFPNMHGGVLFRLVDDRRRLWSFYNDSATYTFEVQALFWRGSRVRPVGAAVDVTAEKRAAHEAAVGSASPGSDAFLTPAASPASAFSVGSDEGSLGQPHHHRQHASPHPPSAAQLRANASRRPPRTTQAIDFFEHDGAAADRTARVVQVRVQPRQTELFVEALDVASFHICAIPLLPDSDTN